MADHKIDDAGEIVLGARKHAFGKGLVLKDIEGLSPEEAAELVTKDAIWPLPEWQAVVDGGVPAEIAAVMKIVRDRLISAPNLSARDLADKPGDAVRADYIEMVTALRDVTMALTTEDEARRLSAVFLRTIGSSGLLNYQLREKLATISNRRQRPFDVDGSDLTRAKKLVKDGFPGPNTTPVYLRNVRFIPGAYPKDGLVAIRSGDVILRDFFTVEDGKELLRKAYEERIEARKTEAKEPPPRAALKALDRHGMPDWRNGEDISPERFLEQFGFRGVQFGESIPDKERQMIVNFAYDGLMDMAHILEMDPKAVSLNGFLAVAFGARGQGRAPAHYEPAKRIFNIGRLNGAGSMAHEWAHSFDHACGEVFRDGTGRGDVRYATRVEDLSNLSTEQRNRWKNIVRTMRERDMTKVEYVAKLEADLVRKIEDIDKHAAALEIFKGSSQATYNGKYISRMEDFIRDGLAAIERTKTRLEEGREREETAYFGKCPTDFAREADRLCRSTDYWRREIELFARAFESALFDRLREMGASSDYLVHGVEEDRYADRSKWRGNPYPTGEERRLVGEEIRALVETNRELFSAPAPELSMTPTI